MFDRLKAGVINLGLKMISLDEKIVRIFLETSPSNVEEIVIMPAVKMVMKKILSKLEDKKRHGRVFNGTLNGVKVSVVRSLVGAPNAAIAVECLRRCETKIILRIDFCGGINKEDQSIKVGDVLIPRNSYCGDGTSPQYMLKYPSAFEGNATIDNPFLDGSDFLSRKILEVRPDEKLTKLALNQGKRLFGDAVKDVDFWTTDALFCEDSTFLSAMNSINVQGIDMENALLFLISKIFQMKAASILSVSDLPGHPKYDLLKSKKVHPDMERGVRNAINIVMKMLPKVRVLLGAR